MKYLFELKERLVAVEDCKVDFIHFQSELEECAEDPSDLENQLKKIFQKNYFVNVSLAQKIINDHAYFPQVPPSQILHKLSAVKCKAPDNYVAKVQRLVL